MESKYHKGDKVKVTFGWSRNIYSICRIVDYGDTVGNKRHYLVKRIIGDEGGNDEEALKVVPEFRIVGYAD